MIFAIKKCIIIHQYIFSLNVTIVTDHKPLLRILLEEKGIPQFTAMRFQLFLSGYNYTLKYKTGTSSSNADHHSQFPKD